MMLVPDASVVVAALTDHGDVGEWAGSVVAGARYLVAPHLMPAEAANILRRQEARGVITADVAALAHAELLAMPVELFPFQPFAARARELRANVTTHDAWYVAIAEAMDATLASLDSRLGLASGPRCQFAVPPDPAHVPGEISPDS